MVMQYLDTDGIWSGLVESEVFAEEVEVANSEWC